MLGDVKKFFVFKSLIRKSSNVLPLKFMFSKKATKLTKSSPLIWHLLHNVKSMVKISSIFVAFSENMNFKDIDNETVRKCCQGTSNQLVHNTDSQPSLPYRWCNFRLAWLMNCTFFVVQSDPRIGKNGPGQHFLTVLLPKPRLHQYYKKA